MKEYISTKSELVAGEDKMADLGSKVDHGIVRDDVPDNFLTIFVGNAVWTETKHTWLHPVFLHYNTSPTL